MLVQTVVIATLLATTHALPTLNERSVDEPTDLNVRSMTGDDDLVIARHIEHQPELERRVDGIKGMTSQARVSGGTPNHENGPIKGGVRKAKSATNTVKRPNRDMEDDDDDDNFKRDLELDDGLVERDSKGHEESAERDSNHKDSDRKDSDREQWVIDRIIDSYYGKLFERDLEPDEALLERDLEEHEDLFERGLEFDDELLERDIEGYEELLGRDFEDLDELD